MQMCVVELTERPGKPLFHLEHYIEGKYIKYNSNSGFVRDDTVRLTPQVRPLGGVPAGMGSHPRRALKPRGASQRRLCDGTPVTPCWCCPRPAVPAKLNGAPSLVFSSEHGHRGQRWGVPLFQSSSWPMCPPPTAWPFVVPFFLLFPPTGLQPLHV